MTDLTRFNSYHGAPAGAPVDPGWRRTVEPQGPIESPVSDAEFASFLEDPCPPGDNTTEQILRRTWLQAATQQVVDYLDREILQRDVIVRFDAYPRAHSSRGQLVRIHGGHEFFMTLPRMPIATFDRVETVDDEGVTAEIAAEDYDLDDVSEPARLHLHDPPARGELDYFAGIRVYYTAGYEADKVPEALRLGVLMLAGYLYEHRGMQGDGALRKSGAASILAPWRIRIGL